MANDLCCSDAGDISRPKDHYFCSIPRSVAIHLSRLKMTPYVQFCINIGYLGCAVKTVSIVGGNL